MVKAVNKDGKVIFYAGHEAGKNSPFFLEINLPKGTVPDETSHGALRTDLVDALNTIFPR